MNPENKSITFDKEGQDNIPAHIRIKMDADRLKAEQEKCIHHPYDRDADDHGNEICTICKLVMVSADEKEEEEMSDEDAIDFLFDFF